MISLPPISTLFPYTTLFRSKPYKAMAADHPNRIVLEDVALISRCEARLSSIEQRLIEAIEQPEGCITEHAALVRDAEADAGDRKSTRLNSSHTVISYAVFCL